MAFDRAGCSFEVKVEHVQIAETAEELKVKEGIHEYADRRLKQLV